jgi:hypothetical protein
MKEANDMKIHQATMALHLLLPIYQNIIKKNNFYLLSIFFQLQNKNLKELYEH